MKKSVFFLTLSWWPVTGGMENQIKEVAQRLGAKGQSVFVVTADWHGYGPREETFRGVRIIRLPVIWLSGLSWLTYTWGAYRFMRKRSYQVGTIICPMLNVTALAAYLFSKAYNAPCVIRLSASGSGGNIRMMQRTWVGRWMLRKLVEQCSAWIYLNDETRRELWKIGVKNTVEIKNGVDTDYFGVPDLARRQEVRGFVRISERTFACLFVGRLDSQKNILPLLEAWRKVRFCRPFVRLFVAGDGPQKKEVVKLAKEYDGTFLGKIDHVRMYYQACDLLILPSLFEGMPNVLLEAMACGLPALVSDIPGHRELVEPWETGFLIDPKDSSLWSTAIMYWMDRPDLREKVSKSARKMVVEHCDIKQTVERYDKLCNS